MKLRGRCKGIGEAVGNFQGYCKATRHDSFQGRAKVARQAVIQGICKVEKSKEFVYDFLESEIFQESISPLFFYNRIIVHYNYDYATSNYTKSKTFNNLISQKINGIVEKELFKKYIYNLKNVIEIGNKHLNSYSKRVFKFNFTHDSRSKHINIGDTVLVNYENGIGLNGWSKKDGIVLKKEFKYNRFQYEIRIEI